MGSRISKPPQTPLWFDLLMLAGLVSFVNRLAGEHGTLASRGQSHRVLRPIRRERAARYGEPWVGAFARRPSEEPRHVQHARARQTGRGRRAISPFAIPLAGWRDVFWRVVAEINNDRLLALAAGVVFYVLLAIFPALAALVSIYGLIANAQTITQHLDLIANVVPSSALSIIQEQVLRLAGTSDNRLSFGFVLGLGFALWSANAGMKAIMDALNVVYDETEKRSFIRLTLVAFAFTIGALLFLIAAVNGVVVLPLVLGWLGFHSFSGEILRIVRWPVLFVIVLAWLAVLYRFGPSRAPARWRWLSLGSVFAALVWLGGSALFSVYLAHFANYEATYGSLGAAVGMMMWLWLSVIVVLVGAEINAELEHQTAWDTTTGRPMPLGSRGATMADTVGAPS